MAIIELDNITRSYPIGDQTLQVLRGISLKVEEG
jgi:hypothetical protein